MKLPSKVKLSSFWGYFHGISHWKENGEETLNRFCFWFRSAQKIRANDFGFSACLFNINWFPMANKMFFFCFLRLISSALFAEFALWWIQSKWMGPKMRNMLCLYLFNLWNGIYYRRTHLITDVRKIESPTKISLVDPSILSFIMLNPCWQPKHSPYDENGWSEW